MTITSVLKEGGSLVIVEDGVTKKRSVVYDDAVCSLPPDGYTQVGVIYVDAVNEKLIIQYDDSSAEVELGAGGDLTGDEIVALLEALSPGSRLSHSKLDDVGASDHHDRYDDAEAVSAMGAKDDGNPLNHDKYELENHASNHTDGTDDIQDATDAQKGLATAAQIAKLDGIDTGADVTADNDPKAHAASHQNDGADEISVAGLSGELADRQPSKVGDSTLGWTADKLLKGAGAGNAPTEIDVPTGGGGYTQGARVYHSVDQEIGQGLSALSFDSERYDTDSIHDTVTNNSRLTCKTAGKYLIAATIAFEANTTGPRAMNFKLNGTTYISVHKEQATSVATTAISEATIYDLEVDDYVEVLAGNYSGVNLDVLAGANYSPEFMMQRIG